MEPAGYASMPEYVRDYLASEYKKKYEVSLPTYVPPQPALPACGAVILHDDMFRMPRDYSCAQ